jgi:DNA-directed RNA polymerase subunit M/transcription elongation factor TFIIS
MTNNNSIVFALDDDEKSYCDVCDYLLIPRANGTLVCSGCEKIYDEDSITLHHSELHPKIDPYARDEPEVIPLKNYYSGNSKQIEEDPRLEADDRFLKTKGRSILNTDTWFPDD